MNTAENTWRQVAGLKPIQSLRCRFGWHRWTSYETVEQREWHSTPYAKCHCADCGLPRIEQAYSSSNKKK